MTNRDEAVREATARLLAPDSSHGRGRELIDAISRADPVPCNGCTACCRGGTAVALRMAWGDNPDDYPPESLAIEFVRAAGGWAVVLQRKPNGDCVFLGDKGCTIHDRRPSACRAFDCRRALLAFTPKERKRFIREGVFSRELFAAADARALTLKLLPVERGDFWRNGADFLGKRMGVVEP